MDFFDRHKALIITLLIFGIIVLGLYNFTLSSNNQKTKELLVDLESFKTLEQEKPEQEPEEVPEQRQTRPNVQTHRAFNENEKARSTNFDQQLNEIFERNSAAREETSESDPTASTGTVNLPSSKKEQPKKRSDGNNTSQQTSTQSGGMDDSSITFSLQGRTAVNIPNPIYTCDVAGKIVINIKVNSLGRVTSTSYNKASSTSSNECLIENAQNYAAQAVFSDLAGRESQPGTITYQFQR
ncbi:hypothetical protein LZ575_13130 [Antarcticibacterium sp. 1MA-6-2]|uniref:hypothetical protein n=1 Tax=Antarcticibacterium sp. 1MA-6-2 TaxID=2908210 RepID=UPI001F43DD40|nr:hypothetical protein [Antarcticibacterium sp. 1MA-6-2]UJH89924.1 hypothetical protein LZ575_13130 [Antarcticibacterium sp. 1MA-6-2]